MKMSFCPQDIIPSLLFLKALPAIGPSIVAIVNSSLATGCSPSYFKHAIIQPIKKKPNLDPTVLKELSPYFKAAIII